MTTICKSFTGADVQKIFDVARTPNAIDASEFLGAFLESQWKSGKRTGDVLMLPEVQLAFGRMLSQLTATAAGGAA